LSVSDPFLEGSEVWVFNGKCAPLDGTYDRAVHHVPPPRRIPTAVIIIINTAAYEILDVFSCGGRKVFENTANFIALLAKVSLFEGNRQLVPKCTCHAHKLLQARIAFLFYCISFPPSVPSPPPVFISSSVSLALLEVTVALRTETLALSNREKLKREQGE